MDEKHVDGINNEKTDGILPFLKITRADNRIPDIETFEDFLSFAAQAFDNREPWHCFLLPVYLQKFQDEITADTVVRLEPVFKNAYKTIERWSEHTGLLDRTFAVFFMSYAKYLAQKFPDSSVYLNKLVAENVSDLNDFQDSFRNCTELYPSYFILLKVLNAIRKNEEFMLLATPTHAPLWIDPTILVKRIRYYQDHNLVPYDFDMQQALLRCVLNDTGEALDAARELLTGELKDLMVYLFDREAEIPSDIKYKSWWMCAATGKNHHKIPKEIEKWGFGDIQEEYLTGNFKWETGKNREGVTSLKLRLPSYSIKTPSEHIFLPEYYYSMFRSRPIWPGDVMRIMASLPNNSDIIIVHILNNIRNYNEMEPSEKICMINALRILLEIHIPLSDVGYLLLGLAFFAPDKVIKDHATLLWIEFVRYGTMDNIALGKKIAELIHTKWLPIQRFTELAEMRLLHISKLHDKALEKLLKSFLNNIDEKIFEEPDSLLEIYRKLLSTGDSGI